MADYSVLVQNEESNEENISLTGLVNGRQVACVVRIAQLPNGKGAQDRFKANAMVDAYLALPAARPNAGGVVVKRE